MYICDSWFFRLFKWGGLCVIIGNFGFFFLLFFRVLRLVNFFFFELRLRNIKLLIFGRLMLDCLGLFILEGIKGVWFLRLCRLFVKLVLFLMRVLLKMVFLFCKWLVKVFFLRGFFGILNFLGFILFLIIRFLLFFGGNFSLFMCRILDLVSLMLLVGKDDVICILLKWLDNFIFIKLLFIRW